MDGPSSLVGRERCPCCGCALTIDERCPLCDLAGLVSPPHLCLRWGVLMSDDHGCEPTWPHLAADHEIASRRHGATS